MDLREICKFCNEDFPKRDDFFRLADDAATILEHEIENANFRRGALLEFSDSKPLIIVPDIHARDYFLRDILEFVFPSGFFFSRTIFDLISSGDARIIFVGDAMHAESRALERWQNAAQDYFLGNPVGNAMCEEMLENLRVLQIIFSLKKSFPENVHFLKGNHENILNSNEAGNFAFMKFCDEGNMTRDFFAKKFDDSVLHIIDVYEKNLALIATCKNIAVSHAEPAFALTRNEIENFKRDFLTEKKVVYSLTWTKNDEAEENSVEKTFKNLWKTSDFLQKPYKDFFWFAGHRPIFGDFGLRQNGHFIQLHNPKKENIALVFPCEKFDFKKNIFNVAKN